MSLALRTLMFACCSWIIVSGCGKTGNLLAVLHACSAVRVLVNMEPMEPRRQIGELRGEYKALRTLGDSDSANALSDTLFIHQIHRHHRIGGKHWERRQKTHDNNYSDT